MARNFIILFDAKEGSSPLVRLLDNFSQIDIIHHDTGDAGWEPFDDYSCGPLTLDDYRRCLELIYGNSQDYLGPLNEIYTKTARGAIVHFDKTKAVGFKMRLKSQQPHWFPLVRLWRNFRFRQVSMEIFRKHDVMVFLLVRQDVFRRALSEYHGDGTGRPGHLQFKLAAGKLAKEEIPRIHVDLKAFGRTLRRCEATLAAKKSLYQTLLKNELAVCPLFYEQFCTDKPAYLRNVLKQLEVQFTEEDITGAIGQGAYFEKVHSDDISDYVENADEVVARYGHRVERWFDD